MTFRLDAAGARVSLSHPLYLLRWTPHIDFAPDDFASMLRKEGKAPLLAVRRQPASGRYEMPFTWNLSNYPHRGGLSEEVRAYLLTPPVAGLPWATDALGRTMFTVEDPLFVTLPPEGSGDALRICCYDIVLNSPNTISSGPRRSQFDAPYPLSSATERRGFHFALNREPDESVTLEMFPRHPLVGFPRGQIRNVLRLLARSASPSNGPPYDPSTDIYPPGSATPCFDGMSDDDGTTSVESSPPDTDSDPEPDDDDGEEDDDDACECSDDGTSFGSFRLRISLGEEHVGEPSGFVWTDIVDPTRITPGVFHVLAAPNVSSVTNAAGDFTVTASGRYGRTVEVASIPDGVLITVRNHSGRVEAKWRIFNPWGDYQCVRAQKMTVLDSVLEDTATQLMDEMGGYGGMVPEGSRVAGLEPARRDHVTDNLTGIMTVRQSFRTLPDEPGFVTNVFEEKYDADGNRVSAIMREYGKFGAGTTARRRLTRRWGYDLDGEVDETRDYVSDVRNPRRHGRMSSFRSNRGGRRLHDYDGRGREILREDIYEDSSKLTTTSYAPAEGDSAHRNDVDEPRDVQVYMRRNGREPVLVSHETWTYTRTQDTNAVPVRTCRHARIAGDLVQETEMTAYPDDYAVPKHLRGHVVSETDGSGARRERTFTLGMWNPGDATFTASPTGTALRIVTQRSFGGVPDETADVEVVDAAQELTLHAATRHNETLRTFDGRRFAYDDVNRLRWTEYSDGTHATNAYSCCRLLWSRGRDGRKTLRSAVTGRDHLYYADEDVWLSEASVSNGFRVVQHFLDAFARETNTVTYVGTTPGEAVDASSSAGKELTSETTEYPRNGWCHSLHVDARGVETMTEKESFETHTRSRESVFSPEDGDGYETTTERHRDGKVVVTQLWDDKWTCETRRSEYLDSGNRLDLVVTERRDYDVAYDDYVVVTNSVTEYDPLGRVVATMQPGLGGAWLVTSNVYDGASSRLLASTQYVPGLAPRTTTCIHDEHGEQVGTELDGVTNRTDVAYAEISNELWRVETSAVVGASTNSITVTRTRLTGLSDVCRSHVAARNQTTGVEAETVTAFNPETKIETTTTTSSTTTPTVRRSLYGLVLSTETPESSTHNAYDGLGRVVDVTRETDELGIRPVQGFVYAPCGDLLTALTYTNATDAVVESHAYDAFGNRVEETDALGNSTCRSYDPFGRVLEEGGATYPVRYAYDPAGRRTSLATTRDGTAWDTTTWTYDPATGLCLSKTYADGTATTYTYTPDGLSLRTTYAGGKWRECVYDARRNLAGMVYSSSDMAYEIQNDEFGRAVSESNATCSVVYRRADGGVATNEIVVVGAQTTTLARGLDAFARQTSLAVSDAPTVFLTYNQKGDVSVVSNEAFTAEYHFTPDGLDAGYTLTTATGIRLRRLVSRDAHRRSLITAVTNTVDDATLHAFDYTHDAGSRMTGRNDDVFTYNTRNEVVGAVLDNISYLYAYDGIGNFVSNSRDGAQTLYSANSLNQYTAVSSTNGVTSPVHDTNGNLISDGTFTYTWDDENRLVSISHGDEVILENEYDAQSRRVRKTTPTATYTFIYDGWNLVKETIVSTNGQTEVVDYVWGRDLSGTSQGAGGVGGLLAVRRNGSWFFPFYDNNGNIVAYVDSQGKLVVSYAYDAFGNTIIQTGTMANIFAHRFSTKYFDTETGFYYYGYRFYSPTFSRWLNRDPIEEDGGVNLYAFCKNSSAINFDKDGRAYFVLRRLKHFVWVPGLSMNPLLDIFNIEVAHEQLVFEDGESPANSGFSDQGVDEEDMSQEKYYTTGGRYNDCVMRKAVGQVKFSGHDYAVFWGFPHIVKCNCQDYATALRRKYSELISDKKIRCECGLGSKTKYRQVDFYRGGKPIYR